MVRPVDQCEPSRSCSAEPKDRKLLSRDLFGREEESFANAGNVIEILETGSCVPAATCDGTCLVTGDFPPLDPAELAHLPNPPSRALTIACTRLRTFNLRYMLLM